MVAKPTLGSRTVSATMRMPARGSTSLQGNGSRPSTYRALNSVNERPPAARLTAGHQSAAVKPRPFLYAVR